MGRNRDDPIPRRHDPASSPAARDWSAQRVVHSKPMDELCGRRHRCYPPLPLKYSVLICTYCF